MQGIESKRLALKDYCKKNHIHIKSVAFIGNDINDKEPWRLQENLCPVDAHLSIKKISDYVMKTKGGDGVIRELYDIIKYKNNETFIIEKSV